MNIIIIYVIILVAVVAVLSFQNYDTTNQLEIAYAAKVKDKSIPKPSKDKKGKSTPSPSKDKKGKKDNTNPSAQTLNHAVSILSAKNKSGQLPNTSSYYNLAQKGYIKYDNGKWTINKDKSKFTGNVQPPKNVVTVHPGSTSFNISSKKVINGNQSSSFCSNAVYSGNSSYSGAKKCGTKGNSSYVEASITDPSITDKLYKSVSDKTIKAAYIAVGTANELDGGSKKVSGVASRRSGCMYNGLGGCINWGNASDSSKALSYIKKQIDTSASLGANAIRLDQVDVCENDSGVANKSCQTGFNKALTQISKYAAKKGLGVIPNNSPNSQRILIQAQNNGGATVIASMVDDTRSNIPAQVKATQDAIGTDIPIITMCTDC